MMKYKVFLGVILIISLLLSSFSSCHVPTEGRDQDTASETTAIGYDAEETIAIKYVYLPNYVDVAFVSDEQKAEWKSALVSLLNNEKIPLYNDEGKGFEDYTYLYPDQPCIETGYQLALFDINIDGIPELLVNVGGGSAGNAFYYVYDLFTGAEIGTLEGGHSNAWCIYFHQTTGKYEAIGQFEWRSGWTGKMRMVHRAVITETIGLGEAYLHETSMMYAYYDINAVKVEIPDADADEGYRTEWEEVYTGVYFSVDGSKASIEEYFAAQDDFVLNYFRITETGLLLFDWDDVVDKDDDVLTKAEKMAEALLTSDQKFIEPKGNK